MADFRQFLASSALLLAAVFSPGGTSSSRAQIWSGNAPTLTVSPFAATLAFSNDGSTLREIGQSSGEPDQARVRAVTFDAATGNVVHSFDTMPGTHVLSVTSDGETAVAVSGRVYSGAPTRAFLLDTQTGQVQDLPSNWYDPAQPDIEEGQFAISGDGRLVSTYSENGPRNHEEVASIYDWPSRRLVFRQNSEMFSAGGAFGGGVTVDGKLGFYNTRVGWKVVDPQTGRLMGWFGPDSIRSPDGALVVEFPDLSYNESAPKKVILKDGSNGRTLGGLDAAVRDDEINSQMSGAFCGTSGRFVVTDDHSVAVYAIPSGALLANIPDDTWRDPKSTVPAAVGCSDAGTRLAILSGSRLTMHDLP